MYVLSVSIFKNKYIKNKNPMCNFLASVCFFNEEKMNTNDKSQRTYPANPSSI